MQFEFAKPGHDKVILKQHHGKLLHACMWVMLCTYEVHEP